MIFIAMCGASLGAAAYFALGFTPVESSLLALVVFLGGALIEERASRRRAFIRLEKGVEEMGRLLATDARAGQVLSQRLNEIADLDLGPRLDIIEADMSVLGTVVRQVAEAVSELESAEAARRPDPADEPVRPEPQRTGSPVIPLEDVRRALDEGRLVHHAQPILTLPQRKLHALDLVPRLELEGRRLADPAEFLPVPSGQGHVVLRRIDLLCAQEAVRIVRRARLIGDPVRVQVDISAATLGEKSALEPILALLGANRAITSDIAFAIAHEAWRDFSRAEFDGAASLVAQGAALALRDAPTLRLDFASLAEKGVRSISASGHAFLQTPAALTDFHSSDINDYIKRFGINLVITGIEAESYILALLDDGIGLAQGRILGPTAALRHDLRDDGDDDLRRAAAR